MRKPPKPRRYRLTYDSIRHKAIELSEKHNLYGNYSKLCAILDLKKAKGEPEGDLVMNTMLEFTLDYQNQYNLGNLSNKALQECDNFRRKVCSKFQKIDDYLD